MQNFFKITISLPREDFKRIESFRKKAGLERSAAVDQAIRFWLNHLEQERLIRSYEEGYKRKPESAKEIQALEHEVSAAFEEESLE